MSKFYSIRFRLTAVFLAIILAVMLIISLFLYSTLERYHMNNLMEHLQRTGFLASEFLVGHLRGQVDTVRLSSLAENISRQAGARVVFIDDQGTVVGDSVRVGGLLNQTLEHEDVEQALDGEVSSSTTYSERIGHEIKQMAIPVREENDDIIGVIFLSTSLEDVHQTLADIRIFLFLSTVLAMAIVGGGSIALARRFTGPLEELTTAARKMSEGKLDQHIEFTSGDEIGRLADQFNVMARRLNYYTNNLKKFAADVAHEVRTPLTTMSLLTKALKEHDMEPQQQREFVEDLDSELDRLVQLVNDLLELSKLEKNQVEYEEVTMNFLLRDMIRENKFRFKQAGVDLIDFIPDDMLKVSAVPMQLRQVVSNLLDNALNYTPAGGSVTLSLYREGNEVITKVEDTGSGIPKEDQSFIFERFYRVDQARSREGGGTGLGLAIVSEIVAKHNGRVWLESEEGRGSSFYFALPAIEQ